MRNFYNGVQLINLQVSSKIYLSNGSNIKSDMCICIITDYIICTKNTHASTYVTSYVMTILCDRTWHEGIRKKNGNRVKGGGAIKSS